MTSPTTNNHKFLGVGADAYATRLLVALGSQLSTEEQEWLSAHLAQLPAFLESVTGKRVMQTVIRCYKFHIDSQNGGS